MSHQTLTKFTKLFLFIAIVLAFIILLFYASKLYNELTLTNIKPPANSGLNSPKTTLQDNDIKTIIRNTVLLLNDIIPEIDKTDKYWYPVRFYFVDNHNYYVEYTNNVDTRKILISLNNNDDLGKKESYKVIAYFKPGKNMWDIIWGKDLFFDREKIVYEYNVEKTSWEIK